MPVRTAGSQFLHVPNKSWVGVENAPAIGGNTSLPNSPTPPAREEKQNYDELERWSQRIPRGLIATGSTNTPVGGINAGVSTVIVVSTPFQMELGRVYKTTGQWSGVISPFANSGIGIRVEYIPTPPTGHFAGGSYMYNVAHTNGGTDNGGSVISYAVPSHPNVSFFTLVGLFHAQLTATLAFGIGPGEIWASDAALIQISVEDLGMYNGVTL